MRKNVVRVECDQPIVTNAAVFLRGPDDEWVDVRRCVSRVAVDLTVGAVSRAHIELGKAAVAVEANRIDEETQAAFAETLLAHGWTVTAPSKELDA